MHRKHTLFVLQLLIFFARLAAQSDEAAALDLQVKLSLQEGLAFQAKVLAGQSSVSGGWLCPPESATQQDSAAWSAWLSLRYPWLVLGALAKSGAAFQLLQPFASEMQAFAGGDQPFSPASVNTAEYSGLAVGRKAGLFRISRFRLLEHGAGQTPELLLNALSGLWLDSGPIAERTTDWTPDGQDQAIALPARIRLISALQPNTVRPQTDWFGDTAWPGWRLWYCISLLHTYLDSTSTLSFGQQLGLPGNTAVYWRTQYQSGPPGLRLNADWAVSSGTYHLPVLYSASSGAEGDYTFSGAVRARLLPLYHLQLGGQWKALSWLNLGLLFRQEQASAKQAALGSLRFNPEISTSFLVIHLAGIFTVPSGSLQAALSGRGGKLHDWEAESKIKLSSPFVPGLVLSGAGHWQEGGEKRLDMEFAWAGFFMLPADRLAASGAVSPFRNRLNPACSFLLRQEADVVYIKPRLELVLQTASGTLTFQAGFSEYWQLAQVQPLEPASPAIIESSQAASTDPPDTPVAGQEEPVLELSFKYQLSL